MPGPCLTQTVAHRDSFCMYLWIAIDAKTRAEVGDDVMKVTTRRTGYGRTGITRRNPVLSY